MKIIVISLLMCIISAGLFAQQDPNYDELTGGLNTITTAVPFLMIAPDSRSGGMGDVGVATSPDVNSMHWNAAKLVHTKKDLGVTMSYVPWLRALVSDINLSYLSAYKKIDNQQVMGVALRYFSLGDITFTDVTGLTVGQYKPHEFALSSCYSRKLSQQFSLAITGRYIYSNLTGGQSAGGVETFAGQSYAADLAGYYSSEVRIAGSDFDLAFGGNISNIGAKLSYTNDANRDFLPINLRLGTSIGTKFDDYNKISLAFDVNKLLVPTPPVRDQYGDIVLGKDDRDVGIVSGIFQSFNDAPGGLEEELREINYSIGSEYWYADQFALRAGYFFEHATKGGRNFFTFGSGVKYSAFILDFSYLINASSDILAGANPLANTMRFTMTWDLGS